MKHFKQCWHIVSSQCRWILLFIIILKEIQKAYYFGLLLWLFPNEISLDLSSFLMRNEYKWKLYNLAEPSSLRYTLCHLPHLFGLGCLGINHHHNLATPQLGLHIKPYPPGLSCGPKSPGSSCQSQLVLPSLIFQVLLPKRSWIPFFSQCISILYLRQLKMS